MKIVGVRFICCKIKVDIGFANHSDERKIQARLELMQISGKETKENKCVLNSECLEVFEQIEGKDQGHHFSCFNSMHPTHPSALYAYCLNFHRWSFFAISAVDNAPSLASDHIVWRCYSLIYHESRCPYRVEMLLIDLPWFYKLSRAIVASKH